MIPTNANPFVPGGRRFTLITPLSRNGRSSNAIMPVSGSSYGNIAHLVKGPPQKIEEQSEPALTPERLFTDAGRYVSTPIPVSTDTRIKSPVAVKAEIRETWDDEASFEVLDSQILRGSMGPVRNRKTRRRSGFSGLGTRDSSSYRKSDVSSDEETSPYARVYSKKLYRSKRVYWYRWAGTHDLETPPPVPADLTSIPTRALFVYYRVGYQEPQIWQREAKGEESSWKGIYVGDKQVINGNKYVLTLTLQGDPSWIAMSTAEKKAQKAKKIQMMQESSPSQSSSSDL